MSIHSVWDFIHSLQNKVEWWELVWHKHAIYDSLSSYDMLFVRPFRLGINLCPIVPFKLIGAFYVGVGGKMLITYFLIACSLIAFGMISVLNVSFLLSVDLGSVPFIGFLN